jgi:tRNA-dihydrouridine synthase
MIYMAPMEGITGYIYRNTFSKYFSGIDKYFTPFISPAKGRPLRNRELKDILPENNKNINVVPQILTNDGEAYKKIALFLKEYGYEEVNINLGCPSGTVVSKAKGSGLLYDIERLDNFLYQVFEADIMKVSIKTRVGKFFPEEFSDILDVYKKYPITELIVHPRVQTDYYKGSPRLETFDQAAAAYADDMAEMLCYNGDIFSASDCDAICHIYKALN